MSMYVESLSPPKAEYINADQLPSSFVRLQLCSGPSIPKIAFLGLGCPKRTISPGTNLLSRGQEKCTIRDSEVHRRKFSFEVLKLLETNIAGKGKRKARSDSLEAESYGKRSASQRSESPNKI
jgi:hypothetical protein